MVLWICSVWKMQQQQTFCFMLRFSKGNKSARQLCRANMMVKLNPVHLMKKTWGQWFTEYFTNVSILLMSPGSSTEYWIVPFIGFVLNSFNSPAFWVLFKIWFSFVITLLEMLVNYDQLQGNNREIYWGGFFCFIGWFRRWGTSFLDVPFRFIWLLISCIIDSNRKT